MNAELVAIVAHIAAAQARVLGMQAENEHRVASGQAVAYREADFGREAAHLDYLSIQARNAQ